MAFGSTLGPSLTRLEQSFNVKWVAHQTSHVRTTHVGRLHFRCCSVINIALWYAPMFWAVLKVNGGTGVSALNENDPLNFPIKTHSFEHMGVLQMIVPNDSHWLITCLYYVCIYLSFGFESFLIFIGPFVLHCHSTLCIVSIKLHRINSTIQEHVKKKHTHYAGDHQKKKK